MTGINIGKENEEANARLPMALDPQLPLDFALRSVALNIAARFVGDTTIKEGNLYQQVKMDNKLGGPVSVKHVINAALVFERYLWGEWSKGIADNAINAVATDAADFIEKEFEKKIKGLEDEPPTIEHAL